jgi:hypothetical protein
MDEAAEGPIMPRGDFADRDLYGFSGWRRREADIADWAGGGRSAARPPPDDDDEGTRSLRNEAARAAHEGRLAGAVRPEHADVLMWKLAAERMSRPPSLIVTLSKRSAVTRPRQ